MKRVENERLRDKENFKLNIPKKRDKFQLDSKNLDYKHEKSKEKTKTETIWITRELDIKSNDHKKENRRKLLETEGKLKIDIIKIEN